MATEISNGRQTVKLYCSVNRGKAMYQLAYYMGGKRVQKNFADKAEAKRVAKQILGGLTNDAEAVEALATPELESLVAARRVLAPNYALHVAVEEHAQAVGKLGEISLREAVEFFLRHNRADVPRLTLAEIAEQFAKSRQQSGLSAHYVSQCRKTVNDLAKAFPGKTLPDLRTAELDDQCMVEWLQALILRIPETAISQSLDSIPEGDVLTGLNASLHSVQQSYSLMRLGKEHDNSEAAVVAELMRQQTAFIRNDGFPSQIRRLQEEIFRPLDQEFERREGYRLSDILGDSAVILRGLTGGCLARTVVAGLLSALNKRAVNLSNDLLEARDILQYSLMIVLRDYDIPTQG
jgi:hypothetical protein